MSRHYFTSLLQCPLKFLLHAHCCRLWLWVNDMDVFIFPVLTMLKLKKPQYIIDHSDVKCELFVLQIKVEYFLEKCRENVHYFKALVQLI